MDKVMKSKRSSSRQILIVTIVTMLLFALLWSGFAKADQLSQRSVTLSNSSINADNVTYKAVFTATKAAGAVVFDVCSNSPLAGQSCQAPVGFSVASSSSSTSGFNDVTRLGTNSLAVAGTIGANATITIAIDHIKNPSMAGTIYLRMITYASKTQALAYSAEALGQGVVDTGSAAIAITDTIGVAATVPETMTFCLSAKTIAENCGDITAATLMLGDKVDESYVLNSDTVSTGSLYTQLSTNAISGAVIRLTSDAVGCGGLVRAAQPSACDVKPALNNGVEAGQATFGVKTSLATDTGSNASGNLEPYSGSGYNDNSFVLNYSADNSKGVTSGYGDPILDTGGAPANNKNMALTFGASVADTTPAGDYSTKLGLVVTGKF